MTKWGKYDKTRWRSVMLSMENYLTLALARDGPLDSINNVLSRLLGKLKELTVQVGDLVLQVRHLSFENYQLHLKLNSLTVGVSQVSFQLGR